MRYTLAQNWLVRFPSPGRQRLSQDCTPSARRKPAMPLRHMLSINMWHWGVTLTPCSSQGYKSAPMKVGARELKNRFGHYLKQVKAGETIHVTDRGKVVAELKPSPPAKTGDGEALRLLAAEGAVTLGAAHHEDFQPYPVVRGKKRASRMIIEDRR